MNYVESTEYLDNMSMFGIKLGLAQTCRLLTLAAIDYRDIKFIHIAGTNGKGSCGAMLQQMLRSAGYKVGFYTSPHLISVRERFRINGRGISEKDFANYMSWLSIAVEKLATEGGKATYFELTTALALLYFSENKVDFAVWETGMGGRLDATNVVTPVAAVITNIALDHQQYLGNSIEEIAFEKAGIIKPGIPIFTGETEKAALEVIRKRAQCCNAELFDSTLEQKLTWSCLHSPAKQICNVDGSEVTLRLPGLMQRRNFALVLQVIRYLSKKYEFSITQAIDGLKFTRWPGRIEQIDENLWVDGGHNPDGIAALTETMKIIFPGKMVVIFGAFQDKEACEELKMLCEISSRFIFVPIKNSFRKSHEPNSLGKLVGELVPWSISNSALEAIESVRINNEPMVVTGSLYLVAEVLEAIAGKDAAIDI